MGNLRVLKIHLDRENAKAFKAEKEVKNTVKEVLPHNSRVKCMFCVGNLNSNYTYLISARVKCTAVR